MSKLALGTVQFGLSYGIANQFGKVSLSEGRKILQQAFKANINLLDTAVAYGSSEDALGDIGVRKFDVVSKLPSVSGNTADIESWVVRQVEASLARLDKASLYGLLLHSPENLLDSSGSELIDALIRVQSSGLVKKLGVSIYDPSELDRVMHLMRFDLVQAPLNLIDRRLETSGWLSKLHQEGIEIHTRSTFLQGLLLMPRDEIPEKFRAWNFLWDNWAAELEEHKISAAAACLSYPLHLSEVNRIVVGVESTEQLNTLLAASKIQRPQHDFSSMISQDQSLINPSRWKGL